MRKYRSSTKNKNGMEFLIHNPVSGEHETKTVTNMRKNGFQK